MILLRLSTEINGVTVEVEGEASDLDQIQESWESFVLATYQVETGIRAPAYKGLTAQTTNEIIEVL